MTPRKGGRQGPLTPDSLKTGIDTSVPAFQVSSCP
ncbi:rCG43981 [Rattus norvegicus]|uniref:RCG43981 n=1 Tax=Rattus norvegicus TaxID=10116 RepID=A6J7D2_RAT|nr:rCG43981 [Rattus norvegicus]